MEAAGTAVPPVGARLVLAWQSAIRGCRGRRSRGLSSIGWKCESFPQRVEWKFLPWLALRHYESPASGASTASETAGGRRRWQRSAAVVREFAGDRRGGRELGVFRRSKAG